MTVVVLTTTSQLAALPGNVAVLADVSGLPRDSVVNVTQVATIDRSTLEEPFPDTFFDFPVSRRALD